MMEYLQRGNINLANAHDCFDILVKTFPELYVYLSPDAYTIHTPNFTNAVIKIQKGYILSIFLRVV